jgi:sporulation protein YlmC with PRC-barrel domain
MRLELGSRVNCTDDAFGELADVVIDPTRQRVTHLVVDPDREQWLARLVPVELADLGKSGARGVTLRATVEEVRQLPPAHDIAYLRLGDFPLEDPDWDVGIQEVLALPYYVYDLEPTPIDFALTYDRIPKSEIEIRRASSVASADGHRLGHVDGFLVDRDDGITHLVLERGHLWGRREITIPVGAVGRVETDAVTLTLSKDEVEALPEVPVRRWPPPHAVA